jgi:hypothetical protein
MTVNSITNFNQGDLCVAVYVTSGTRIEFFTLAAAATSTFTISRSGGFLAAHSVGDTICNGVDVWRVLLPPGEVWEITPVNYSGQSVVMAVDFVKFVSDTVSP